MSSTQYTLAGIAVSNGESFVLEIDALEIAGGKLHLLMGPNGSGKSTLLRILAFLDRPAQGEMTFSGAPVAWNARNLAALRRKVTLLQQHPYLFSGSVLANVAFGARMRGISKEARRELASSLLRRVGLEGFEKRNARHLSGGEASRVSLARALACKPEVLLLNEPLAQADKQSVAALTSLIAALPAEGLTVVMSSHDDLLAERLGDSVIHLREGRVSAVDRPPRFIHNDQENRCDGLP